MTLKQHQERADTQAGVLLARLDPEQDAHFATASVYWQGLSTHSQRPSHTAAIDGSVVADELSRKAGGHAKSWGDFVPPGLAGSKDCAFIVNTYNGPSGQGYELRLELVFDDVLHLRVINQGPETYRELPWTGLGPPI